MKLNDMGAIKKIYTTSESNLSVIGWLGVTGYPIYYYVWHYLYPQPYDSLIIRLICSLLFFPLAIHKYLPSKLNEYKPYYYVIVMGIGLPFFFSFMMFMNHWSDVWAMSLMAALFLHILTIYDTRILLTQSVISFLISYLFSWMIQGNAVLDEVKWQYIPIFLFSYIFGNLCYTKNKSKSETKISTTKSFGVGIAHEMRNPLSALKHSLYLFQDLVKNKEKNRYELDKVLSESIQTIDDALETIEILLMSIDETRISIDNFKINSIKKTLDKAVQSFGYKNNKDKELIKIKIEDDFEYLGSESLLIYTIFNLMKNSFYYKKNNEFMINIYVYNRGDTNHLIFLDNGKGIHEDEQKFIFDDFYTNGKTNGFGLGLPFCKRVMSAFCGDIFCHSVYGEWTEFELVFPAHGTKKQRKLINSIMDKKSIIYLRNTLSSYSTAVNKLLSNECVNYSCFDIMDVQSNLYKKNNDLYIVDLDRVTSEIYNNISKCNRVIYLTDDERKINKYVFKYEDFIDNSRKIIFKMLFSNKKTNNVNNDNYSHDYKKVLVVDDNRSILNLTSLLLKHNGYIAYQAMQGDEAIHILDEEDVDIIIMDLEMPVMNGIEITKIIRRSDKHYNTIPIIGHTGDDQQSTIEKLIASGMNDYLIKPSTKEQLVNKLQLWI
ncbi:response regulator [Celerinatantimonas sp. YJH-8]|uniref:hybrid sensor histidine kinase/response regulator n=1 Tax=Celerinatantimonas sp. YJH-8 TaxID=3228714 RepID=UPI0038C66CDF